MTAALIRLHRSGSWPGRSIAGRHFRSSSDASTRGDDFGARSWANGQAPGHRRSFGAGDRFVVEAIVRATTSS
jgi:hypothetical protein